VGRPDRLAFTAAGLAFGPLSVAEVSYGSDMRLDTAGLETAYHVLVPVTGGMRSRQGPAEVAASRRRAAVFRPEGAIELRWPGACRLLSVKVDREALESELTAVRGAPRRRPAPVTASIDLATGSGRSWAVLLELLGRELADPAGLVRQPRMADRWAHLVLGGLAVALEPPDDEPSPPLRPRTVKRALDAMHADPAYPFTAADLAVVAGTGVRVLQDAFRRYVGLPPLAYLRQLRLTRAHEDLLGADPRETTVADIAARWGFAHLGRFAGAYRARYGVSPSHTLRGGRL
jgi:AraC-like DNA-binding protein